MKEANKIEKKILHLIAENEWSLHFDGKMIQNVEHQVLLLKNEREPYLAALRLCDGKAVPIFEGIGDILDKHNA